MSGLWPEYDGKRSLWFGKNNNIEKKKGERDETMTTLIYHCYGVHLTQAF